MLYYFNPLFEDGIFYSCGSLRYSFEFPDIDIVKPFLSFLFHPPGCIHHRSLKNPDCRYLLVFGIRGLSFPIGLCVNGVKKETVLQGFLDFNPNRMLDEIVYDDGFMRTSISPFDQEEVEYRGLQNQMKQPLRTVLNKLFPMVEMIKIKRWDLAVSVPYGHDRVRLIKDNRKYSQFYKSAQDSTEYLGCMSAFSRVRVYNKQVEAGLDYPLTRIKIILDSLGHIDCCRCWSNAYTRKAIDLAESKVMIQPLVEQPVDRVDYYLRQMSAPMRRRYKALLLDRPFEIEGSISNKLRS